MIVAAAQGVAADLYHLAQHLGAVAQVADTAALVVAPGYRHLFDTKTELARDEQDLRIETPTLDRLQAKDILRRLMLEGFEAALGVHIRQTHHRAGEPVVAAAEEPAVHGLVRGLFLFIEPARTDGDIRAVFECLEEALGLLNGGGQIGVGEHDDLAGGLQQTVTHGVTFAAIARVFHKRELRVHRSPAVYHRGGVIGRAVIHHQHLGIPAALPDAVQHAPERILNAHTFVIRGDDDANARKDHWSTSIYLNRIDYI